MSATVLESLSNKKLISIILVLCSIQLVAFYIGAFKTPAPSAIQQFTSNKCLRKDRDQLAIPRNHKNQINDGYVSKNCKFADPSSMRGHNKKSTFMETTFAVQLPLPRDFMDLSYSRWMQTLLVILNLEFHFEELLADSGQFEIPHQSEYQFPILMDVDLAVKNSDDSHWQMYAQRKGLKRTIQCKPHDLRRNYSLDCDQIQLFELQSLYYDYYLINFEIREDLLAMGNKTMKLPVSLNEITGVAIHHNGGFIQVWLLFKTICFLATLSTLIWYCNRLQKLNRTKILIERILICLGTSLTMLNTPVEFLTLIMEVPCMTFVNDLRQGMFYCILFSFWIIFVGEHLQDGTREKNSLASYGKELLAIFIASLSLLVFDLSERGIQTFDPFLSIWETKPNLANLSICVALCASLLYIGFLSYYIYLAYMTISGRAVSLPKMQVTKRLKYQGIIYRFKFLLWATIVCALSTFTFYAFSQKEDRYHDDESVIEWTSAMLMTVSAMWNLYVIILMILYAPSYKGMVGGALTEQIEFDCLTENDETVLGNDMQLLQNFASKANFE